MPQQKHALLLPSCYAEAMGRLLSCSMAADPHWLLCLSTGTHLPVLRTDLTQLVNLAEENRSLLLQVLTRFSVLPGELQN